MRHAFRTLVLSAIGAMLVGLAAARPVRAEVIERVVAVVNDEAIFLSELRRRAVPFLPQVMTAGTEPERMERLRELYSQLLDLLIDERLIGQAARKENVTATSADVDRAVANIRRQARMSEEEFAEAIAAQGLTETLYRSEIRKQVLRLKLINLRVRSRINVTDEDIRARYNQLVREARRSAIFHASHIFFPYPPNAGATQVAATRAQAEAVREGLTPENFAEAMAEHDGGDLGELRQGSLPEALESVLLTMEPETLSAPVASDNGVHIFFLHSRTAGSEEIPSFEQARAQIQNEIVEGMMQRQETQFLEELRRAAVISKRL